MFNYAAALRAHPLCVMFCLFSVSDENFTRLDGGQCRQAPRGLVPREVLDLSAEPACS